MLRVIDYFASSLQVTQNHSKWHIWVQRKSISIPLCICYRFWDIQPISASNSGVTLKSGLRVVQGLWKWRHSIDNNFLLVGQCKYSFILYRLRVIWRWISWPRNSGYRSLKVIKNGTFRKLFTFDSNYGSISYLFRDKARYWPKFVIFFIRPF